MQHWKQVLYTLVKVFVATCVAQLIAFGTGIKRWLHVRLVALHHAHPRRTGGTGSGRDHGM